MKVGCFSPIYCLLSIFTPNYSFDRFLLIKVNAIVAKLIFKYNHFLNSL